MNVIKSYSTLADLTSDLSNLADKQIVSVDDTERLYRIESGVPVALTANSVDYSVSGDILTITF